jgi:hypothetical protein
MQSFLRGWQTTFSTNHQLLQFTVPWVTDSLIRRQPACLAQQRAVPTCHICISTTLTVYSLVLATFRNEFDGPLGPGMASRTMRPLQPLGRDFPRVAQKRDRGVDSISGGQEKSY